MRKETVQRGDEVPEAESIDLDEFTGYEDGNSYVVCDRRNPQAWIRSDVTETLSP
jgi:hypothetical protein